MSKDQKIYIQEWLIPLLFVGCMAWVVWNGSAFIISFGWAEAQLSDNKPAATILEWLAMAGVIATFIYGIMTLRLSTMEHEASGVFDRVSLFLGRVTMILVGLLVSVMFFEVVMRYVFEKPTLWANELSLWMAGFVFMLAGLYGMQQRSHIRIYLLYDAMPRWLQKVCDTISVILIVLFAVALVYGAYGEAGAKFLRWETFGTAFDPPLPATVKPILLVVISLVALQAVSNLFADWNKEPVIHTDEPDEEEIEALRSTLKD